MLKEVKVSFVDNFGVSRVMYRSPFEFDICNEQRRFFRDMEKQIRKFIFSVAPVVDPGVFYVEVKKFETEKKIDPEIF